jgi:hypothetical protein
VLCGLRTLENSTWAVAMKIEREFCCYRSCKRVFESETEYLLHARVYFTSEGCFR